MGNPSISFLDEPTTGVDPVARRCLWDAIGKKLAQGCSLVLTSHSMEECEALCNRLIIMVNGQICCIGSPLQLKAKFGNGYTVLIRVSQVNTNNNYENRSNSFEMTDSDNDDDIDDLIDSEEVETSTVTMDIEEIFPPSPVLVNLADITFNTRKTENNNNSILQQNLATVQQFMAETFPSSSLKAVHNNMLHYSIEATFNNDNNNIMNKTDSMNNNDNSDSCVEVRCSQIFGAIERAKHCLQIEDYSVCQTNLEQIFLSFARKQRDEDDHQQHNSKHNNKHNNSENNKKTNITYQINKLNNENSDNNNQRTIVTPDVDNSNETTYL